MKKNIQYIKLLKKMKCRQLGLTMIGLSLSSFSFSGDFYTIIGPDGRPMVIQQKVEKKNDKTAGINRVNQQKIVEKNALQSRNNDQVISTDQVAQQKFSVKNEAIKSIDQNRHVINHEEKQEKPIGRQSESLSKVELKNNSIEAQKSLKNVQESDLNIKLENSDVKPEVNVVQNSPENPQNQIKKKNSQTQVLSNQDEKIDQVPVQISKANISKDSENFKEIDGVKYVDNEYLENREFNLERRKRFYVVPETGTARQFETVEREKGISKSMLDKFMSKGETDEYKPVVLSPTYYRLPKQAVVESLEQACFTGKKLEKAKSLSQKNKEVGLWPVPPLKEKFVYEIIRMDVDVQNIQLNSYALSQKNPNYYWPLVVFLDQKGCVMEGVSGFKNENKKDSNFQHAALEGVLKKPDGAVYLFMTPLAESVDVQDAQLSNQGQIKLTVLK